MFTMTRIFEASDADRLLLAGRTVAVIGYGSQGRAHAHNLSDSGVRVVVGLREGGPSWSEASAAGLEVRTPAEAAAVGDVIAMLIPDPAQPKVYQESVLPHLSPGKALLFAHGFNIHYGQIKPPPGVDVVLVAPKSPGHMLRREYRSGRGVPALVGVHQDGTGKGLAVALAYADAIGSLRAGVLETTFGDETETDLFGEQAVLCGGLTALVKAGFETLVEAGYSPDLAYFECLHELKLIVDLCYQGGLSGMRHDVSDTAEFGDYVSGPRVIADPSRRAMREILADIRSGAFAERWINEAAAGGQELARMRKAESAHLVEQVGEKLRARMAWLNEEPEASPSEPFPVS